MAGPLSSEEIEDVVSSVRRLVSNEQSPRRASRDLNAERLLLTPSLRVVSEIGALSPLILDGKLPDPIAEQVSEAPDPGPADNTAEIMDGTAVELIEADWEDEIWAAPEPVSLGEVALGAEEAEVLTPVMDAGSIEIGTAPEEMPEPWAQAGSDWVDDEPAPFVPLRRRAENLSARLAAQGVIGPDLAGAPVVETDLAGEAAPDHDPSDDDFLAATDLEAERRVDSAQTHDDREDAAPQAQTVQRIPTEILDADGTALAVLDEAALQEIVRQMIREELQGSLGERITRNVRKLVRAEINRALVARDLD